MARAFVSIGELARRAGVAASALRYYEAEGLLESTRSSGNQRHYPKDALRRVAFIRAAQTVGLTLEDIRGVLARLPDRRTPTAEDWQRVATTWRPLLDARIAAIERVRDKLTSCIGCGCLSLTTCQLYNANDVAAARGPGARYLIGDRPPAIAAHPGTRRKRRSDAAAVTSSSSRARRR